MSSWNKILSGIKNDARLVKKEGILFSVIYIVLSMVSVISSLVIPNLAQSPALMLYFIAGNILLSFFLFINQYYFQKAYSVKKNVPAGINGFWKTFLRIIQLYAVQLLIVMGISVVLMLVLGLGMAYLVADRMIMVVVMGVVCAGVILFWIYRINFVSTIFLYYRMDWKSHAAIQESIYLIKSNALVVVPVWILPLLLVVPGTIDSLRNPGTYNPHIIFNSLMVLFSLVSSIITIYITVQAVIDHKYCFLLKPEEQKKLAIESD